MSNNTEEKDEVIMYDSPEAAQIKTLTGWVSSGKGGSRAAYYANNEHNARWAGCTHVKCECGNIMEKVWTKCESCRHKARVERYNDLPFKKWDYKEPVCTWDGDKYFFDLESLEDHMFYSEEPQINLLICEPIHFTPIDTGQWDTHEEWEPSAALEQKINEFNKFLKTLPPHSYRPGKFRTTYYSKEVAEELQKEQQ